MKLILLAASLALLLVSCSGSKDPQKSPKPGPKAAPEQFPEPEAPPKPQVSIHQAARTGNLGAIHFFIKAGSDLDAAEPKGPASKKRL